MSRMTPRLSDPTLRGAHALGDLRLYQVRILSLLGVSAMTLCACHEAPPVSHNQSSSDSAMAGVEAAPPNEERSGGPLAAAGGSPVAGSLVAGSLGQATGGTEEVGGAGAVALTHSRSDGHPNPPDGYPLISFPIADEDRALIMTRLVIGVDHDPGAGENRLDCQSHDGRAFPACYDDHMGSDFILEGGFRAMDAGSARVVAVANGVVTALHDGEYDRCHADLMSADVTCDGHPMRSNLITITHAGGWETSYLHLKTGSLRVSLGDEVTCGQPIALIGSSGYSSAPHLHLEVEGPLGRTWDPFAGSYSQDFSLWIDEGMSPLPLSLCLP